MSKNKIAELEHLEKDYHADLVQACVQFVNDPSDERKYKTVERLVRFLGDTKHLLRLEKVKLGELPT